MKKFISILLIFSMLFITGCSSNKGLNNELSDKNGSTPNKTNDVKETPLISTSSDLPTTDSLLTFNTNEIHGKIKNIYYDNDTRIIVWADELYLYDLVKGKVLNNTKLPTTSIYLVQPIKDGYVVIGENDPSSSNRSGMLSSSETGGTICTFYNHDLKQTSEIAINAIHDGRHSISFANYVTISKDGNLLAFNNQNELYIYDISKKQKNLLLSTGSNNPTGIAVLSQIGFTNNDKSIAFKADSFLIPLKDGSEAFSTYGMIDIDGANLINHKIDHYAIYEMTNAYDDFVLYSEDFRTPTGQFLKMNTKTGKAELLKASEKEETGYAIGSDKGAYYATALRGTNSWIIRIYDIKTSKLISTQEAPFGEELYGYRIPSIKVIDATRTCIVLLGATQSAEYPTKIFIKQF